MFFFFQAEDGIRAGHVTGVQTCALPISMIQPGHAVNRDDRRVAHRAARPGWIIGRERQRDGTEIGRASWRERVEMSEVHVQDIQDLCYPGVNVQTEWTHTTFDYHIAYRK